MYFCNFIYCMVNYTKHILHNGLTVLTHEAADTPLATVNVLYNVGARDEDPGRTGFAHLFEHLMFSGTPQVPDFDAAVSAMSGECNAFTNNDYTNYYMTVPSQYLQDALRLEADRMKNLRVSAKALEVQQRVVTEEYKQRYVNQPYGDVWLLLRPLCYKVHPYRWCTIGSDIRHVSEAGLDDVVAFHQRHYRPENAVLAVASPLSHDAMLRMVEEAFGSEADPAAAEGEAMALRGNRVHEPEQTEARELTVEREVPTTGVYLAYPMWDHFDDRFRACDLLSDVLSNGKSSRLYNRIVKQGVMTEADAYITGDAGDGLFVLCGKLNEGVTAEQAQDALRHEVRLLAEEGVGDYELAKVVNKYESTFVLSQYKAADRALALCYYTWQGDTGLIDREPAEYAKVRADDLRQAAVQLFVPNHENRLIYLAK